MCNVYREEEAKETKVTKQKGISTFSLDQILGGFFLP
jgi:hypothetical protein